MYAHKDALTLLLTAEGLLFAALSLSVAVVHRELGETTTKVPFFLAMLAATVVALLAAGGISAWASIYDASRGAAESASLGLQGAALAAGILVQPVIAFVLAAFAYPAA